MVTLNQTPASVEGIQVTIAGQDIRPTGRPKKLVNTGEIVYPLKVAIRGAAKIIEEKIRGTPKFKNYSMVNVGDEITGKNLWGFGSDPIGPGDITVGGRGRTSSHTGQEVKIYGVCFMELIMGWTGNAIGTHPRQELLE